MLPLFLKTVIFLKLFLFTSSFLLHKLYFIRPFFYSIPTTPLSTLLFLYSKPSKRQICVELYPVVSFKLRGPRSNKHSFGHKTPQEAVIPPILHQNLPWFDSLHSIQIFLWAILPAVTTPHPSTHITHSTWPHAYLCITFYSLYYRQAVKLLSWYSIWSICIVIGRLAGVEDV